MMVQRGNRWGVLVAAFALALMTASSASAAGKVVVTKTSAKPASAAKPAARNANEGSTGPITALKALLGITALENDVADLQDQNDSQQSQIAALLLAVGALNADVAEHDAEIDALQECCDMLTERVSALEAIVYCENTVCNVGGVLLCIDTQSDHDHCDACNSPCAANEDCVEGSCQLKPCDPVDQCHSAVLMMDGTCVQSNLPNTTTCNDGQNCTLEDLCQSGVCVGYFTPCDGTACIEGGKGGYTCE